MWVPLMAVASAAVATIFPPAPDKKGSKIQRSDSSSPSSKGPMGKTTFFFLGVAAGMGLGAYLSAQMRRQRVRERMRASYLSWLNDDHNDEGGVSGGAKDDAGSDDGNESPPPDADSASALTGGREESTRPARGLRLPTPVGQIRGVPLGGSDSSAVARLLASPDTALTSSLHVAHFTLPPGTRTRPREARGVEVYYVLGGSGVLMRDGNEEGYPMSAGCAVVVNPWSVRWIANKGRENMAYLRVADGGNQYAEEGYDAVAPCEKDGSITMDLVDGFRKVGTMLRDTARKS